MNSFITGIKNVAVQAKGKLALVGAAGAGALMLPGVSHATLSTEEQAMVTAVVGKVTDMGTAVTTFATANLGLVATIIIAGFIIYYMKTAGR